MKVFLYTTFALVAFAFNSILCRLALRGDEADAAGFTAVRLVSGAAALVVIGWLVGFTGGNASVNERAELNDHDHGTLLNSRVSAFQHFGNWPSAFFLFAYAVCFSFAYLGLSAGTGALILFGAVQLTMVAAAISRGERPTPLEWTGLVIAVGGLVYLVLPGLSSPPLASSLLMAVAGVAWGVYSIRGKGSVDPLGDTAGNFARSVLFAVPLAVVYLPALHLTTRGWLFAVLSGAVTSGVGYTVWYAALKYHTSTRAAVLQLAVPVIAAVFGIILLGETATATLSIAAALILGGIGLTIAGRKS
ncbi:MAG: EamA family transporter [Pyrinomonadaceae bacterium]|nr:EamA family transporter [Pyrinomonadaceae bacterium]